MTDSAGGRVLAVNVAVTDDTGRTTLWRRGQTPPPQVADRLGAHVFVGGDDVLRKAGARTPEQVRELMGAPAPSQPVPDAEPEAPGQQPYAVSPSAGEPAGQAQDDDQGGDQGGEHDDAGDAGEPPRSGQGATRAAWHAYAAELGQVVDADAPRDAVIQQLADAGLIEP